MKMSPSEEFLSAPSHDYLYHNPEFSGDHLSDNGKAFLSPISGFIPPQPLPFLPYPYSVWHNLAKRLPQVCQTNEWQSFVACIPEISAKDLQEEHLLRSNIALGSIAHAIHNVGRMEIPAVIMKPWSDIASRLGRPSPCLPSLDLLVYNVEYAFAALPTSFASSSTSDSDSDSEIHSQILVKRSCCRILPSITLTGSLAESNYINKGHRVELAAGPLPGIVAAAHQAVIAKDDESLRKELIRIIDIIEQMTIAFTSADPRPLSDNFMDHVEWGRSIDVSAFPVVQGEKTGSGLLFPSIHLLDLFFSRDKYDSEMGELARKDRPWLPTLHQGFFEAVKKISVVNYILSDEKGTADEMLCIFRRALAAFASEKGFMGKHRIRLTGYLEAMFKGGRKETGNGLGSSRGWESRIWRRINQAMLHSMEERIGERQDWFHEAVVKRCVPLQETEEVYQIVIETKGALVYKPGDHVAILVQNNDKLIQMMLDVLGITADEMISVTNKSWKKELRNRRINFKEGKEGGNECLQVHAKDFLQVSALQPLDAQFGERLIDTFSVANSFMAEHLRHLRATNVPTVLEMLLTENPLSREHLIKKLDFMLEPLVPRFYSVASHMSVSPRSVEIIVGRVRYEAEDIIPSRHPVSHSAGSPISKKGTIKPLSENLDAWEYPTLDRTCGQQTKNLCNGHVSQSPGLGKLPIVLEGISSSFLSKMAPGTTLSVRAVPELEFRLPQDKHAPIIMVSIGTGVAPFKSFLKELIRQKREFGMPVRSAWLILGVKSRSHIPFREDIEEAVCKEKVAHFSLAFSREDIDFDPSASLDELVFRPGTRKRLFEMVVGSPALVNRMWNMISDNGHIYVCGNPNLEPEIRKMVASVVKQCDPTSRFILSKGDDRGADDFAEEYADRLMANKRLHVDCFSSGKPQMMQNTYTYADVATHHVTTSCWVTFRGFVYDLTRYIQVHPGGPKILLDKAGRDMTIDFNVAHGAENLRVVSMMEPYKIGSLRRYSMSNDRMQQLMKEWSVPLLYDVLERRSVFTLDRNNYPELKEPEVFRAWKSHHSSDRAVSELCQKFWDVYEPDIFGLFEKSLHTGKLRDLLSATDEAMHSKSNTNELIEEIKGFRTRSLREKNNSASLRGVEATRFLEECANFMEEYCELAIDLQRIVEVGLESCEFAHDVDDRISVLVDDLFGRMKNGVRELYRCCPLVKRAFRQNE